MTRVVRHPAFVIIVISIVVGSALNVFIHAQPTYRVGDHETIRLIRDTQETHNVYFIRSHVLADGEFPYKDTKQEYPLLGVVYLSWPRLFTDSPKVYETLFGLGNAILLIVAAALATHILWKTGKSPWAAVLLALPASLYFSLNRFDIVPAVVVLSSLVCMLHRKFFWAIAFLAVGFFVKWYTFLLIPIVLIYAMSHVPERQRVRISARMIGLAGMIISIPSVTLLFFAGTGSLFPYAFHMSRGIEYGNVLIPYLKQLFRFLTDGAQGIVMRSLSLLLFVGQIMLPIAMLLTPQVFQRRIRSFNDVVRWMLIVIILFLLMAKFYSPQFFLWVLPLCILTLRRWTDVALIVMLDLSHYLAFPVVFDALGWASMPYAALALMRTLLYGLILYRLMPEMGQFLSGSFRSSRAASSPI